MPDKNDETTVETSDNDATEQTQGANTSEDETQSEGNEPEWKKEITKVQNETQSSIARLEHRVSELIGRVAVQPNETETVTVVVPETRNRSANASDDSTETTPNSTPENQTNQNNENNDQTPEPPVRHVGGVLSRRRR